MNKHLREREELRKLSNAPKNRQLKLIALAVIAIAIILLLGITFWLDNIPTKMIPIMRGCAGVCAILFVVLVGILSYRVNKQHISNHKNI